MILEDAPIQEIIQNELGVTPSWQSWFSVLSDAVSGEYIKGAYSVVSDYQPIESTIVLAGTLCAANMVWDSSYPNTEFTMELPRDGDKPLYFVKSIILVYAETQQGVETLFAKVDGTIITMPAIEDATAVILNGNLILERI